MTTPDPIFVDPRLARLYDAFDDDRGDLDLYVRLAERLGARSVLVLTGYGLGEWEYRRSHFPVVPDHVAADLLDAVEWVIARRRAA